MKKNPLITSKIIIDALAGLTVLAFVMQIFIDDTSDNIASDCIVLVGSLVALAYFRFSNAFETHPISTFTIFGFCANTLLGALLVQSAMLNSLTQYLRQPLETFATLCVYLWVAILAHIVYRIFSRSQVTDAKPVRFGVRPLLEMLQVYATPTVQQLWVICLIGMVGLLAGGGGSHATIANKVAAGLAFLAWAPYLIPIYVAQLGPSYCNARWHYFALAIFTVLIVLIGIVANIRTVIVAGATTVGMVTILTGLRSRHETNPRQIMQVVALLALCVAMLVPMSKLATAMASVRGERYTASPSKMIHATIDALFETRQTDKVLTYEKFGAQFRPYDEYYITNPVLARFVNTKFHDNSLYFESRLNERAEDELADTTVDLFWVILPDVVLKYFDIKVAKNAMDFSMGDYLYHQATGGPVGGHRYGSIFAHGIGLFGRLFTIVYFGICLVSFLVLDLLTFRNREGKLMISVVGILLIWRLFLYGVTSESINNTFGFLFREIPQSILLFTVVFLVAKFFCLPLTVMDRLRSGQLASRVVK